MKRQIRFEASFDDAVGSLGGYELIDGVLESIIDGLQRNPYGYPYIENDWVRVRYVITKAAFVKARAVPALVFLFEILADGNVSMRHVERHERY